MNKNAKILCFGELLIDMISETTGDLVKSKGFSKQFGGAPGNTASGLAKLGIPVYFMGKVGDDPFGHFLKNTLEENNVKTDFLNLSKVYKTTLAFVALEESGERDFTFYKGAHENLFPDEFSIPDKVSIFHFGSLTQTNKDSFATTEKLLNEAKSKHAFISYDPNVRESLWDNKAQIKKVILETAKKVDMMKVNEEEAKFLADDQDIISAAGKLFSNNLDILIITLGSDGCYFKTKKYEGLIKPPIKVKAIDTTGAGDAFNAGLLSAIYETGKKLSELPKQDLDRYLTRANIIGALTTTKKGAITAFPTLEVLKKYV